jgi:ferritin-like metal-binding protein YciE
MDNKNSNTKTTPQNGNQSKEKSTNAHMQSSPLMELFEDELMDIYWAEKALTKAIPKMVKNATSPELKEALENHLEQTHEQVGRVEMVFEILGKKASAKKCEAMEGLIKEGGEIMEEAEEGAMRDAGIISAGQKIEHYEIASYGTLRQFAETLGLPEAVSLLEATLNEEKAADAKLSEVAQSINFEAAEEDSDTMVATKTKRN